MFRPHRVHSSRLARVVGTALLLVVSLLPAAPAAGDPRPEVDQARFLLDRLGFGPRPGEVERVSAMGPLAWIDRQLQPERIDDSALQRRLARPEVLTLSTAELFQRYPNPASVRRIAQGAGAEPAADDEASRQAMHRQLARTYREKGYGRPQAIYQALAADRLLRATYSERQLQEVMVDFWSNHFNIYARKGVLAWYLPAFDREVIRPHAMGKFSELLKATAQSPAMLFYLDNIQSVAADSGRAGQRKLAQLSDSQLRDALMRRRGLDATQADAAVKRLRSASGKAPAGLNENYARELMELHTLGVDGGYTQQDVHEVARAFSGWTVVDPRGYRALAAGAGVRRTRAEPGAAGSFVFDARRHDSGAKTVLGHRIDAGGMDDGLQVLDLLARQPATAHFIARKLAVKFVSDTPPPALVDRVAAAFLRSHGDIRTTLRELFHSDEFLAAAAARQKIKTPFELVASSLRALDAQTDGGQVLAFLADLGEPLYGHQAPNGYPDTAQDWVNSGALLKRMNYATALAGNRIPGTRVDLSVLGSGDVQVQLDRAVTHWLGGALSADTRAALRTQLQQPLAAVDAPMDDVEADAAPPRAGGRASAPRLRLQPASGDPDQVRLAALLLGSPDFQRQ